MHPEADAFLDAIFDHPDDDTPRLVYADWLQEHGQENYAQFIRLQCAAAREKPWSDAANRLWEEIGRVWNRLDEEWWPATRDWSWLDAVEFHRGFLRQDIDLTAYELVRYDRCWTWLPSPVMELGVTPDCDNLDSASALPTLRRLRRVRCCGEWSVRLGIEIPGRHDGIDALLRSPHLCAVTDLDLSEHRLTPSNLDALLTAPNLASVTNLKVTFDARDWSHLVGGCLPEQHEAARKLRNRFPNVYCDFE